MSLRALNVRWTFVQRRPQRSEEAEAQSAEQSGIRAVKRPFDPNITTLTLELLQLLKVWIKGRKKFRICGKGGKCHAKRVAGTY